MKKPPVPRTGGLIKRPMTANAAIKSITLIKRPGTAVTNSNVGSNS